MTANPPLSSPATVALLGALGLAAAMGIGRFAFTPLLPLMQASHGLTLGQGAALASANYLGYLLGALFCFVTRMRAEDLARIGLAGVAAATLGMALGDIYVAWVALRFIAGGASAMVLVGISTWALGSLGRMHKAALAGWVFSGVGAGISIAGFVTLIAAVLGASPRAVWYVLGAFAGLVALRAWGPLRSGDAQVMPRAAGTTVPLNANAWRLIACYGAFGFGYIIPATFLPFLARQATSDPLLFGWAWPVFGTAAAASTAWSAHVFRRVAPRTVWRRSQLIMAAGVVAPAFTVNAWTLALSALCVGGTFMVITMAGMQEARLLGPGMAPRAIAGMTAAFAAGQLLGPMAVQSTAWGDASMTIASFAACGLLLASTFALRLPRVKPTRGEPGADSKETR